MDNNLSALELSGLPSAPPRDSSVRDCDLSRQSSLAIDIPARSRSRSPNFILNCSNSASEGSVQFLGCCRRRKSAASKQPCCGSDSSDISNNSLLERVRRGAPSDYLVSPSDYSLDLSPYSPTDSPELSCLCRQLASRVEIKQQCGNTSRSAPPSHPLRLSAVNTTRPSTRDTATQTDPAWIQNRD